MPETILSQGEVSPLESPSVQILEEEVVKGQDDTERREAILVNQLRAEAISLKECFTRYSFQAISICGIVGAGIVHFMFQEPLVGLGAVAVLPILLSVCRLGTYKYGAANRQYAYELHLTRTRNVPDEFRGRWKNEYRKMDWEVLMRVWRVVQPTLFEAIYHKSRLFLPERLKKEFKPSPDNPMWFSQQSLFGAGATAKWRAGSYLEMMLICLRMLTWGAVLLLWLIVPLIHAKIGGASKEFTAEVNLAGVHIRCVELFVYFIAVLATIITYLRGVTDRQRCRTLADGVLSIRSSAIVWQAVIIAHHSAVEKSQRYRLSCRQLSDIVRQLRRRERKDALAGNAEEYIAREQKRHAFEFHPDGVGLTGYSFWLGQEAASLANCAHDIHSWIATRRCERCGPT
jgi:hypothetical protein